MILSIDHEILVDKYLRDPQTFRFLIQACRDAAGGACRRTRRDAQEALDLLESLYAICCEQEVAS